MRTARPILTGRTLLLAIKRLMDERLIEVTSHTCFFVSMLINVSCRKIAGPGPDASVDSKAQQDV
jgi:hypothetical protein